MSNVWIGRKHTEESKRKMRLAKLGKKQTIETISKRVSKLIGRKNTIEAIEKMRAIAIAGGRKPPGFHGKKHSVETKLKISKAKRNNPVYYWRGKPNPRFQGVNNPRWKGGISKIDGYKLYCNQIRRARKLSAIGTHTFQEWESLKLRWEFMCLCCKKVEPEVKLTEDHIVPLSRGGSNGIDNIQPLCMKCNAIKHSNTIDYRPSCVVDSHLSTPNLSSSGQ